MKSSDSLTQIPAAGDIIERGAWEHESCTGMRMVLLSFCVNYGLEVFHREIRN